MAAATSILGFNNNGNVVSNITKASEIPKFCSQLYKILSEQPMFDGTAPFLNSRIISLENWDDVRICDIFSENIDNLTDAFRKKGLIYGFSHLNGIVYNSNGEEIPQGLGLRLYEDSSICSISDLEGAYNQVLDKITTGWRRAAIEDNPDMMDQENPDEFDLFIKDETLIEEDTLIRFIASRLSLENDVHCFDTWLTHSGYKFGKTYLWIRKSEFENVVDKFGFKF